MIYIIPNVPNEISLYHIFCFFKVEDTLKISLVCSYWNKIIHKNDRWKNYLVNYFFIDNIDFIINIINIKNKKIKWFNIFQYMKSLVPKTWIYYGVPDIILSKQVLLQKVFKKRLNVKNVYVPFDIYSSEKSNGIVFVIQNDSPVIEYQLDRKHHMRCESIIIEKGENWNRCVYYFLQIILNNLHTKIIQESIMFSNIDKNNNMSLIINIIENKETN